MKNEHLILICVAILSLAIVFCGICFVYSENGPTQGSNIEVHSENNTTNLSSNSSQDNTKSSNTKKSNVAVCTEHDTNGDGYCTKCGKYTGTKCTEHDTNGDGYCTKCGQRTKYVCTEHDTDGDGYCTKCGQTA